MCIYIYIFMYIFHDFLHYSPLMHHILGGALFDVLLGSRPDGPVCFSPRLRGPVSVHLSDLILQLLHDASRLYMALYIYNIYNIYIIYIYIYICIIIPNFLDPLAASHHIVLTAHPLLFRCPDGFVPPLFSK